MQVHGDGVDADRLDRRLQFDLQMLDVDSDPALLRRYDEWVPVLCYAEREICHYYLDERALRAVLHEDRG